MKLFRSKNATLEELCDMQRARIAELEKQLAERDEECQMYLNEAVEIAEERDTWRELAEERLESNKILIEGKEAYEKLVASLNDEIEKLKERNAALRTDLACERENFYVEKGLGEERMSRLLDLIPGADKARETFNGLSDFELLRLLIKTQMGGVDKKSCEIPNEVAEFQPGMKVWVIKAKFIYGRAHVQQIASIEHFKRISELEAVFYVAPKLACKSDEDKLGRFVFLTEEEAEAKLKEYIAEFGREEK